MTKIRNRRGAATCAAITLALAACGGGSDDTGSSDSEPAPSASDAPESTESGDGTVAPVESDSVAETDPVSSETVATDAPTDTADSAPDPSADGSFEPGEIEFRAVNLLDEPVDLYARTTGLVEAFLVQPGLAPGEVSEWIAPPEDGILLVTQAGADDPTCVGSCDQFVAELSTFPEEGPTRTVVLWGDEFDPSQAFELWEQPTADAPDAGNAMPPAQADAALAVVVAVALTDADFGIRAGTAGVDGCLEPIGQPGILIGGNQTPVFALTGPDAALTFYDQPDSDCTGEPVGGPVDIDPTPGSRSLVLLSGSPGSIESIVLEMESDGAAPTESGGAGDGDGGEAVALMADEVAGEFGLDADTSSCVAELLVDAIGADVLVVDGALVDLDTLPDEFTPLAGQALVDSVDECGVDPAVYGG